MSRTKYAPTPLSDNPLSRFLRQWLDEHNLSRVKAAKQWGVSHGTLRNVEAGIELTTKLPYRPRLATLRLLAKGMGVPLDLLIKLQGEELAAPPSTIVPAAVPTLSAIADLLDRKQMALLEKEAALGRDALNQQIACFREMKEALQGLLRRAHKERLSPTDRKQLRLQVQELQRLLDSVLERQASFHDHFAELLPAMGGTLGSDVQQVTRDYVRQMRELLRQLPGNGQPPAEPRPPRPVGMVLLPRPEGAKGHRVTIHERTACGPPDYRDDYVVGTMQVNKEEVGGATHMVEASGDSMIQAGIQDGDQLFYIPTDQARPGNIVLASVPLEGLTVKFFKQNSRRAWLEAANPDKRRYPDLPWTEGCRIIGVVVHVRRYLDT